MIRTLPAYVVNRAAHAASITSTNLADSTLLELTANGELILAGGSGSGYRFAGLMGATNP